MFFEASASNLRFSTLRVGYCRGKGKSRSCEAHCLLSSVRSSCLAHCRSQFCAAHRKSLSLHLPQAAVELVSPNVPQSLLGDALNPNKSDIYLAGSRRYIPDLTSGLLLCTAVGSHSLNHCVLHCDMVCKAVTRVKFANV